ncbi:MAG: galactose oxidase, partial [Stenotrophobium sp.]
MRTHKALLVRTGIFAVAATLAACGGGSSPISSTGANTATSSAADAAVNPNDPPAVPGAHSSAPVGAPQCPTAQQCQTIGGFTPTFVEPVIYDRSGQGDQQGNSLPITNPLRTVPQDGRCTYDANGRPIACKPAGNSVAMLKDGRILFFNALEGTENVEFSIVTEAGQTIINDQTRVLSFSPDQQTATWTLPGPVDGGAAGQATPLLPGGALNTSGADPRANSGALFCADLKQLSDGRIIAVGGTNYYFEPGISNPFPIGVAELEGLKSSRIFDPATNTWVQAADMNYGRWYPSLTTLPDGDLFVASGVTKLLKPVYPNSPFDSGRNVTQTETYSLGCNTWTDNGGTAERSLPLFPRDHLLPNGQVYYNGGGQAFNPFGQAYDQALWNIVGAYDSVNKTWTDLGYAGLPLQLNQAGIGQITTALNPTNPLAAAALQATLQGAAGTLVNNPSALLAPVMSLLNLNPANAQDTLNQAIGAGFRGSTFSMMMPLKPDPKTGQYDHVEFLTAGGVFGAVTATSPGSYIATALSRIDTIDLDAGAGSPN